MEEKLSEEIVEHTLDQNFAHMFQSKEEVEEQQEPVKPREEKKQLSLKQPKEEDKRNSKIVSDEESSKEETDVLEEIKEEKKKYTDWKAQAEKESKRLRETQKWANDAKSQIAAYRRAVEKLVNEGILIEEDAQNLLDHTQYREIPDSTLSDREKATKIFREEIENIRKYGNYENLDAHVKALDHLVDNSTQEEIEEMFAGVEDLVEEDSVAFTKKILEIAAQYYEDVYADLHNAGGLKNMKADYQKEITKRDKIIDKLEKEVIKLKKRYEDYDDSPQYRIPQAGGDGVGGGTGKGANIMDDPGDFMEKYHRGQIK